MLHYRSTVKHVFFEREKKIPRLKVVRILNVHSVRRSLLQDLCGLTNVTYCTNASIYAYVV